jgi:hypothetical protein
MANAMTNILGRLVEAQPGGRVGEHGPDFVWHGLWHYGWENPGPAEACQA